MTVAENGDQTMDDSSVGTEVSLCVDVEIILPDDGTIRIESARLCADPDGLLCRRFLGRAFLAPEIDSAEIDAATAEGVTPAIELRFDATQYSRRDVLERVAALLDAVPKSDDGVELPPACTARDRHGAIRYHRCGQKVTGWKVVSERVGIIKLENPVLYRKTALCEAVERELMSVLGVNRYETSSRTCWAKIEYDPRQLSPVQIIEILDGALANAEHPDRLDPLDLDLAICTASLPLAAVAQFAMPALLPVSAALFAYTTIPSFRGAYRVLSIRSSCWVASRRFTCSRVPFFPGACRSGGFWCGVPRTARRSSCSELLANSRGSSG